MSKGRTGDWRGRGQENKGRDRREARRKGGGRALRAERGGRVKKGKGNLSSTVISKSRRP